MLVLTRAEAQEIQIGPDVVLKVLRTSRNTVRLGFVAPKNVHIRRVEIADNAAPPIPPEAAEQAARTVC